MDKKPRPALVVAGVRTGGHFLTCALSNHVQIFCVREEPWHRSSTWRLVPSGVRLKVILEQRFCDVSMCKLTVSHVLKKPIWKQVCDYKSLLKVLYLERVNLAEQAVSDTINNLRRTGHPAHTFSQAEPPLVTLRPEAVIASLVGILQRRTRTRELLKGSEVPVLYLTYEGLTGGVEVSCVPEKVATEICSFLEVDQLPLCTRMRKVHRKSYSEFVSNWVEIRALVEQKQGSQGEPYGKSYELTSGIED